MSRSVRWLPILVGSLHMAVASAFAQSMTAGRLAILQAEDRRAGAAHDLATLQTGVRSRDDEIARLAVRALGRLERPALIPSILPALDHRSPSVRAEAACALAQAMWSTRGKALGKSVALTSATIGKSLAARLVDEPDPEVRASLAESIGRVPYGDADAAGRAERALLDLATSPDAEVSDRLAAAKGLEVYVRVNGVYPLSGDAVETLRLLARALVPHPSTEPSDFPHGAASTTGTDADPQRSARIRRLAFEALLTADAVDGQTIARGLSDTDAQVRRLALRAVRGSDQHDHLLRGLLDPSAIVRLEALRRLSAVAGPQACQPTLAATSDADLHVALLALDQLAACGDSDDAVDRLAEVASRADSGRASAWQPIAHALVALATARPERARSLVARSRGADVAPLRAYVARAATRMRDRDLLARLATDTDDNVAEAAIDGLADVAGRDATAVFVAGLSRRGNQAVRAAARALRSAEPREETIAALRATLGRLTADDRANASDVRTALIEALTALGVPPEPVREKTASKRTSVLTLDDLRRAASPRARLTIRGVGTFDLALVTQEAPATVVQFVRLVESGYYNGTTFHRIAPNFVIQGGSPDANEYVGHADHMRDEVGLWPHVRGAVGISTRGRDTGDAQIFIDLVDNPRLDHEYTVFGYVVAGMEVVDRILESDTIEKIEMLDLR